MTLVPMIYSNFVVVLLILPYTRSLVDPYLLFSVLAISIERDSALESLDIWKLYEKPEKKSFIRDCITVFDELRL